MTKRSLYDVQRRRGRRPVAVIFLLLSLSAVDSFSPKAFFSSQPVAPTASNTALAPQATKDEQLTENETWSRSQKPSGSRFGVRRRVKAVLAKAKNRTSHGSATVVAEAASIGGLDKESDLVYRPNGARSVLPKNDTETNLILDSATSQQFNQAELNSVQVEAMLNSNGPVEPLESLPFTLPTLTQKQKRQLLQGERIQEQSKMGREGSGFVVLDVNAPPFVVWECLLDFEAYPENIGTVRSMRMFTNTHLKSSYIAEEPVLAGTGRETRHYGIASVTRASFVLSKFRLNIAAIHKYRPHPDGHYMVFTLDKACKNVVLQDAKGIWHTQPNPDGRGEEWTRVWLLCELKVSRALPSFIVDYAARKAMPRATTWLPPTVEAFKTNLEAKDKATSTSS